MQQLVVGWGECFYDSKFFPISDPILPALFLHSKCDAYIIYCSFPLPFIYVVDSGVSRVINFITGIDRGGCGW